MFTVADTLTTNNIVSVIIPTKNSASTLKTCLKSVKNQTYKPIEVVVIDNYSTDNTGEIAQQFADIFELKGPERSAQRNYGVSVANGKYVAIIDSDMKLAQDVIQQAVNAIQQADVHGVVIPEESYGKGFWAQCKKLERSFYVGVPYMEAARFFRKSTFEKLGGYDEKMISGEDWHFSQKVSKLGNLSRTEAFIYHNEGKISLLKTISKKYYYARNFSDYHSKSTSKTDVANQTSILKRYWLFLSSPVKLFRNPLLGIGMLFMKTCEFAFGAVGYVSAYLSSRVSKVYKPKG